MYRIIQTNGTELGITEDVNYIKVSGNGCFVLTDREHAVGVAFRSEPYNLLGHQEIQGAGTVIVSEIDGGAHLVQQAQELAQYAANLDYLSMMTGVELTEEEEVVEDGTQQEV
jgi:hypothetical protein